MKNKHRIKQCLSLLLAGGIALTNLGAVMPAFAEDAPATPENAEAVTPETAEADTTAPNLVQITECILFIRGERPVIDLKYNLLKHPNICYTEDGGAAPYDYASADNARDDLPCAPENYELLDMDDFLPAEAAEMKPTIQRIRRSK